MSITKKLETIKNNWGSTMRVGASSQPQQSVPEKLKVDPSTLPNAVDFLRGQKK